jgi:hypothetical protein
MLVRERSDVTWTLTGVLEVTESLGDHVVARKLAAVDDSDLERHGYASIPYHVL